LVLLLTALDFSIPIVNFSHTMNPDQQALAIYEKICATSADRPFTSQSIEQLHRELAAWQQNNPGLTQLRQASPDVQTAFLRQSVEWLKAESRDHSNFLVTSTMVDAIRHALGATPKPLSTELVLTLLTELRENTITRYYFPFDQFLLIITRNQVNDDIRAELRRLHLQYAPSPTGKIDERTLKTRNLLAGLMQVEGEKQPEPGRGPWSQIVFGQIAAKETITASGWQALLEHCRTLEQTIPGAKWKKRSQELIGALGEAEVWETLERWLALGPTPGQPPEARSPIEDSPYQKGVVFCLALSQSAEAASAIGDFGIACLRKIPMLGAVSQKVGFACVQALGSMDCNEAVSQLARLRAKVKYAVAQRLIEKCLHQAAQRNGITVDELEDIAVPSYSLDAEGKTEISIGDVSATIRLADDGHVVIIWRNAEGKPVKSVPSHIKKAFPKEVKSVSASAKELEQAYLVQRDRLESSFLNARSMSAAHWRKHFIEHPLLGLLGRRLIWVFSNDQGWEHSGIYSQGQICDVRGEPMDVAPATKVRLWHPLSSQPSELQQWRERVFSSAVRQPFRQAFREFYQVADNDRQTKMYSNRFAGIVMRQHQFSSLCRARGWSYRLMGSGFDGFNVPAKLIPSWNMHAEFYVDLPSDRDPSLLDSGLGEQSGSGINLFLTSDQVRFYRDRKEIAVDEVPAIVYSEVMRDIDLFTSVSAVGQDESWSDQGERGTGVVSSSDVNEFSAVVALRIEILSRVLPLTPIAKQCRTEKAWLEVQGQLGTYRILISWDSVLRMTDAGGRQLHIPPELLEKVSLDLAAFPIELDHRTEIILRKAYVLANDWKIDSPDLIRQLM
jgi:uncharacterized protein DUF4132